MYSDLLIAFNLWNYLGILLDEEGPEGRDQILQMILYAFDEVSYRTVSLQCLSSAEELFLDMSN